MMDCNHTADTFKCITYIRNYDADTVTFNIPDVHPLLGRHISVRVAHIDTPEIKGKTECEKKLAIQARDFVGAKLKSAYRVNLIKVKRDKYFRILADIEIDGELLSKLLLSHKYAVPYEGELKQQVNWCSRK